MEPAKRYRIAAVAAFAVVSALLTAPPPSGATAAHRPKAEARIAQLTKINRQLQRRLRNMTIVRNRGRSALAAANVRIGSLQAQNASLQASLQQRTNERDAALAQVAFLQAQLSAIPKPLTVAVEQVRRQVDYQTGDKFPYSQGRLVAQAAMDYVVGHVSASAYGYLDKYNLPLPSATPDSALGAQAGICGHAALTLAAIVKRFGYQVRSVQFYYTDPAGPAGPPVSDNHIADEVFYDGGWHFFDPTFGVYWTDANANVLSITDVRTDGGTEVKDRATFTNLYEDYYFGDGTAFETDPATVVAIGQQPFTG